MFEGRRIIQAYHLKISNENFSFQDVNFQNIIVFSTRPYQVSCQNWLAAPPCGWWRNIALSVPPRSAGCRESLLQAALALEKYNPLVCFCDMLNRVSESINGLQTLKATNVNYAIYYYI